MVFKGTRDYDADELADTVQAAGGHWNAYTSFDRTVYYIDGPADSLPVFLKCLTGLVFFPTSPESEFEKEKDVIRREIDMGLDDPDNAATRLLFSTAFQLDPRRHPVIGHRHRFDAIRYEDLIGYHRDRYTPDRCFAVISGDFDPDEARKLVTALTAECLHGCGREPLVAIDPPQLGPRRARETFAIPASRISLAWKSPALDHPDAPAFDVLAAMLGRGRASRLHRTLREERGLALEISAFSWTGPGREGIVRRLRRCRSRQTRRPDRGDPAGSRRHLHSRSLDDDLAKAKRQIAASQFRSLTTASGRAVRPRIQLARSARSRFHPPPRRRHPGRHRGRHPPRRRHVSPTSGSPSPSSIRWTPRPRRASAKSAARREDIQVHTLPNGLSSR